MTHHDNEQNGSCGSEKHHSHAQLEKKKEGCCKSEKDKTEQPKTQGDGCCGGDTK